MQATSCFVQLFSPPKSAITIKDFPTFTTLSSPVKPTSSVAHRVTLVKAALSYNYNSSFSVFPAEACETVGGEACAVSMFPEAKLNQPQETTETNTRMIEEVDREYFDYDNDPKSVLRAEACDDLGGEFCTTP